MRIIYYDLETTGLQPLTGCDGIEIVQIGAISMHRGQRNIFDDYLLPNIGVTQQATATHGLTYHNLHNKWEQGNAFLIEDGLLEFVKYIDNISRSDYENEVILVAHNNFGFDSKVLINNLQMFQVELPYATVGLFDTLELMKKVRIRSNGELPNLKLTSCLDFFFDELQPSPHNAYTDANDLRRVSEKAAKYLGYGSLKDYVERNNHSVKWWIT